MLLIIFIYCFLCVVNVYKYICYYILRCHELPSLKASMHDPFKRPMERWVSNEHLLWKHKQKESKPNNSSPIKSDIILNPNPSSNKQKGTLIIMHESMTARKPMPPYIMKT